MEEISNKLKSLIGNLSEILIAAIGLLVVVQVVFGTAGNLDVISNLTGLVDRFIGSGASLASLVTHVLILGVLSKR